MLQAELHGKIPSQENHEDVLTSDVFGALHYLDRDVVWRRFANNLLHLDLTLDQSENTRFDFWPYLSGNNVEPVEPDIVIDTEPYLVLVECKFGSDFYEEQLAREIVAGRATIAKAKTKRLVLLAVSSDAREPDIIEKIKTSKEYGDVSVQWINWQRVRSLLKKISGETSSDLSTKRMLKDVVDLMEKKGLRGFRRIDKSELNAIGAGLEPQRKVYEEYCVLRNVLIGELNEHGIVRNAKEDRVWRDGCSRSPRDIGNWLTRYLLSDFRSKEWIPDANWFSRYCLFTKLLFTEKEKPFWFGYRLECWGYEERENTQKKAKKICEFSKKYDLTIAIRDTNDSKIGDHVINIIEAESLIETDFVSEVHTLELFRREDVEDIDPRTIVDTLVLLRNFVDKSNLFPVNVKRQP